MRAHDRPLVSSLAALLLVLTATACISGGAPAPTGTVGGPLSTAAPGSPPTVSGAQPGRGPAAASQGPAGGAAAPASPAAPSLSGANPIVPRAAKLTPDGCCPAPQWLADGSGIFYYGPGGPDIAQRGTWAVPREGGATRLLSTHYGAFSPDRSLVAYPDGRVTQIARLDGTVVGAVENEGVLVHFSPTNDRVAWLTPAAGYPRVHPALEPPARVAVANVHGGDVRVLAPVVRTETLQWFPDGRRVLFSGRDAAGENPGLLVLDTATGGLERLADGGFLENALIAPDGQAVVYTATLQPEADANGIWLVNADGSERRRLGFAGGYRWTSDGRALIYVPAPASGPSDELWRYRLAGGTPARLVGAAQVRFAIAQDDWELAPDGAAIVYRSAVDGAVWILHFVPPSSDVGGLRDLHTAVLPAAGAVAQVVEAGEDDRVDDPAQVDAPQSKAEGDA